MGYLKNMNEVGLIELIKQLLSELRALGYENKELLTRAQEVVENEANKENARYTEECED